MSAATPAMAQTTPTMVEVLEEEPEPEEEVRAVLEGEAEVEVCGAERRQRWKAVGRRGRAPSRWSLKRTSCPEPKCWSLLEKQKLARGSRSAS